MEMLSLFPRYVLKGHLPDALLTQLITLAGQVLANPDTSPDASVKLAGQLDQQRELRPQDPAVTSLPSTGHLAMSAFAIKVIGSKAWAT